MLQSRGIQGQSGGQGGQQSRADRAGNTLVMGFASALLMVIADPSKTSTVSARMIFILGSPRRSGAAMG
jgi:hypothetical protein